MFRRKKEVKVVSSRKEKILDLIAANQSSETILTHRALWLYVKEHILDTKNMHFTYEVSTDSLYFREGHSSNYWFKFTF